MKKLLSLLAISLILGIVSAEARNSAVSYDAKYYSQQEFVQAYNSSTAPMYRDFVVGLTEPQNDAQGTNPTGPNPNVNIGQYITEGTNSTTDNIYAFGVVDDTVINPGQLGRICIRGPHKVVVLPRSVNLGTVIPPANWAVGTVLSQCASNVPEFENSSQQTPINGGFACPYTTATGTAGAMIGYVINATATTDTGDVGQSTNAQSFTTGSEYWAWIDPRVLR